MQQIIIDTEYIKLSSFLKLAGIISMGSEAKNMVLESKIKVNGEIVYQRGKKLRDGDIVQIRGMEEYVIKLRGMS